MKRAIFILCLFIAFTTVFSDDFADKLAEQLSISKIDMQTCLNKTNVVVEDLMKLDQSIYDNVETEDIDKSVLKVGCLFACLLEKKGMLSGSQINVEKIKEFINIKLHSDSKAIAAGNQALNKCADQVKSKTDECEITIKFFLCMSIEMERSRNI